MEREETGAAARSKAFQPKPIRKRAYFRALKRREPWALQEKSFRDIVYGMSQRFEEKIKSWIYESSPFQKLIYGKNKNAE